MFVKGVRGERVSEQQHACGCTPIKLHQWQILPKWISTCKTLYWRKRSRWVSNYTYILSQLLIYKIHVLIQLHFPRRFLNGGTGNLRSTHYKVVLLFVQHVIPHPIPYMWMATKKTFIATAKFQGILSLEKVRLLVVQPVQPMAMLTSWLMMDSACQTMYYLMNWNVLVAPNPPRGILTQKR